MIDVILNKVERGAINNLSRIIFDATQEIQNGKEYDKDDIIDKLKYGDGLEQLLLDIFKSKLNIDYDEDEDGTHIYPIYGMICRQCNEELDYRNNNS